MTIDLITALELIFLAIVACVIIRFALMLHAAAKAEACRTRTTKDNW